MMEVAHPLKVTTDIHKENIVLRRLLSECATFLRTSSISHMDGNIVFDLIDKIEKAIEVSR